MNVPKLLKNIGSVVGPWLNLLCFASLVFFFVVFIAGLAFLPEMESTPSSLLNSSELLPPVHDSISVAIKEEYFTDGQPVKLVLSIPQTLFLIPQKVYIRLRVSNEAAFLIKCVFGGQKELVFPQKTVILSGCFYSFRAPIDSPLLLPLIVTQEVLPEGGV